MAGSSVPIASMSSCQCCAETAFLRPAVAEDGSDRVELLRLRLALEAVLEVGTDDRRRRLRAQRQRALAAVGEGVHLLAHDVRAVTGGAGEELGVLEDGGLDPPVAVEGAQPLEFVGQPPAQRMGVREDVVRSARRFELAGSSLPLRAQIAEERVALELRAEGRCRPVTGIHDRLGRVRIDERADRCEQRLPARSRQIRPADRAGEQHVTGEEAVVHRIGEVRRGMPGHGVHAEREPGDVDRLVAPSRTSGTYGRIGTGENPSGSSRRTRSPSAM